MNLGIKTEFHRWRPETCLKVSGEDAARFLQGQFTNDLQKADKDAAVYGLWLNQKGKVLADSFVQRWAEQEFRVVSYFSAASVVRERLEAYIIADDVVIEDLTPTMTGLTVMRDTRLANALPDGASCFVGRRGRGAQREILCPLTTELAVREKLGLGSGTELNADEMERRRIRAGIPAIPKDIGPADLPNEGGLETDAISYTKGCYLGQEVMARLKSMGQVRRRLVTVSGPGMPPALPAALFQHGRKVGELRSAVREGEGWIGMAMVVLLHVSRADGLALAEGGPATIKLEGEP